MKINPSNKVGGIRLVHVLVSPRNMAKSKSDLESDHRLYQGAVCKMQRAIDEADYLLSIRHAQFAWKYIDGMIQYSARYLNGGEFANFECIYHVLQFAPLVFHQESLKALSDLLKTARRVNRSTPTDLAGELTKAKLLMMNAHALWQFIESNQPCSIEECRVRFSGDTSDFQRVLRVWQEIDLIKQCVVDNRQCLSTRQFGDTEVRAKCFACGVVAHGVLRQFLDEERCPLCQTDVATVFLSPQ
jgi:hypothetical protein